MTNELPAGTGSCPRYRSAVTDKAQYVQLHIHKQRFLFAYLLHIRRFNKRFRKTPHALDRKRLSRNRMDNPAHITANQGIDVFGKLAVRIRRYQFIPLFAVRIELAINRRTFRHEIVFNRLCSLHDRFTLCRGAYIFIRRMRISNFFRLFIGFSLFRTAHKKTDNLRNDRNRIPKRQEDFRV